MARLAGKVALITGAARGLGAAIAQRFRQEGASVIVNDLDPAAAKRAAVSVEGAAVAADVSDPAKVRRMFEDVARSHGRLDVLVNNAGISGIEGNEGRLQALGDAVERMTAQRLAGAPVDAHIDVTVNTSDADWRRVLAVHLDGTFYCSREALRLMSAQGGGCIINMGSIMGTSGGLGAPAYCAAKAGILGLTRALAREVVTRNIRVNAIAPGFIDTDMTAPLGPLRRFFELQTPMGRFGEPDDIAWAAVYLASDEAKFVTGQVLSPNGGWHMSQ